MEPRDIENPIAEEDFRSQLRAENKVLDLFDVMPSLQQDDSDMLFHECSNCNFRCNCSDQPCSCCNEA